MFRESWQILPRIRNFRNFASYPSFPSLKIKSSQKFDLTVWDSSFNERQRWPRASQMYEKSFLQIFNSFMINDEFLQISSSWAKIIGKTKSRSLSKQRYCRLGIVIIKTNEQFTPCPFLCGLYCREKKLLSVIILKTY